MIYIGTSPIANTGNNRRGGRNAAPVWNYNTGDSVRVSCYTNCDEAELFINGKSLGKKSRADTKEKVLNWSILHQPGELMVKGFKDKKETSHHILKTADEAYAIRAVTDRNSFAKNKKQMAHIEVEIIDKNGTVVYNAENEIDVKVEGPATLSGLESGSSVSHEDYKSNKRKALHGKLLGYVQSNSKAGLVKVTVKSPGLKIAVLQIKSL